MEKDAEGNGAWNVSDKDNRITTFGHFLRNSKIDELPQLINVFIGSMSFVGPRPELKYYVNMYSDEEKRILDMKPGITDWASIINFDQYVTFTSNDDPDAVYLEKIRPLKLKLQIYYRENNSFFGDIKILFWTFFKILSRSQRIPKEIENIVNL